MLSKPRKVGLCFKSDTPRVTPETRVYKHGCVCETHRAGTWDERVLKSPLWWLPRVA